MKSIVNFRDLGGYSSSFGGFVAHRKLLRSGELTHLIQADREKLIEEYMLKTVVDFRAQDEVEKANDAFIYGVTNIHIDVLKDFDQDVLALKGLIQNPSSSDPHTAMRELYKEMVLHASSQRGYRYFFELLLKQESGSLLFHCSAGKDRTGLAAAFVLAALGVSKEDIYKDYLQTNIDRERANEAQIKRAIEGGLSLSVAATLKELLCVDASYLDTVFDTIQTQYGDIDTYLEKAFLLDTSKRQRLCELYLVG